MTGRTTQRFALDNDHDVLVTNAGASIYSYRYDVVRKRPGTADDVTLFSSRVNYAEVVEHVVDAARTLLATHLSTPGGLTKRTIGGQPWTMHADLRCVASAVQRAGAANNDRMLSDDQLLNVIVACGSDDAAMASFVRLATLAATALRATKGV